MSSKLRVFEDPGVVAKVSATIGKGPSKGTLELEIDPKTGKLSLPEEACFGKASRKEHLAGRHLVSAFHLSVGFESGDPIVVTQRMQGNTYLTAPNREAVGDLTWVHMPPCEVKYRERRVEEAGKLGLGQLAVWSNQMYEGAPNRADIFVIGKDGGFGIFQIFVLTLDDGKSFQLVGEWRWEGQIYRRKKPGPYEFVSNDHRQHAVLGNNWAAKFLSKYVVVPEEGYESFEQKVQCLLNPDVRGLLENVLPEIEDVWEGRENFWLKLEPKVSLRENANQGVVQFYVHGLGDGAMGVVHLNEPVTVGKRECQEVQVRHYSFVDAEQDEQGLNLVRPGDIIEYDRVVSMDHSGKQFAPLLMGVRVLYQSHAAAA